MYVLCVCANYVHLLCGHKQSVATAREQFAGLAEVFRRLCVVAEHPKFVRGAAGIYPIRTWRSRHEGGSCAPSAQVPPERDSAKQHWPVVCVLCVHCVVLFDALVSGVSCVGCVLYVFYVCVVYYRYVCSTARSTAKFACS